jgi:hypothetical protein
MNEPLQLVAIKIERRSLAVALFIGTHLDYTHVHNLPSDRGKAETSAMGLVRWLRATFNVGSAAIEEVQNGELRRVVLGKPILEAFREQGIPAWQIEKAVLFSAFAHPPLKNRKELRETAMTIWPVLNARNISPSVLDAAALGLYIQTERLFQN